MWHDGTEISSGFQTKPWLVAITACSTRYRPPADFFGYEVVEASQSWMTVSQHQGARGSHAAPPPLVATLRVLSWRRMRTNLENPSTTGHAQSPWLEGHQRVRARPSECASVKCSTKNHRAPTWGAGGTGSPLASNIGNSASTNLRNYKGFGLKSDHI